MTRDYPDWGHKLSIDIDSIISDLTDAVAALTLLVSRVESMLGYAPTGTVVWSERFDTGLSAWSVIEYSGSTVTLDADVAKWGAYCVKISANGTQAAQGGAIERRFGTLDDKRLGLEVSVAFVNDYDRLLLHLYNYDGSNLNAAVVYLDRALDKIKIRVAGGAYQNIADLPPLHYTSTIFHSLKLVADFDTNAYVKLLINDMEYDLSGYSLWVSPDTRIPYMVTWFAWQAENNVADDCYLDGVILTKEEE